MSLNLLNSFGAKGVNYGLYTETVDVIDTEYLSRYFVVSEFNPTFTAGKNAVTVNGSPFLVNGSEILMECLDSLGNCLFIEMAKYSTRVSSIAYKESSSYVFSIHVYNDTADGVGKLILYGTLIDGRSVKWIQNIVINKALKNQSRVRFYQSPILQIESSIVPILNSDVSTTLISDKTFSGNINGLSINPLRDTNLSNINKLTTDIDYRLTLTNPIVTNSTNDTASFNSQMIGSTINLYINKIQSPQYHTETSISQTSSYVIKDVLNNNTIQIDAPYYYMDGMGNSSITNIIDAKFSISYSFINYYNSPSRRTNHQTERKGGKIYTVKQSYADISYKNIRTFSGYVARHKIYRKSMTSNGDFSLISDDPIIANQILMDDVTQNKYYDLMGKFYNDQHIARYWFTSSNNISIFHSPAYAIDSMYLSSSITTGNDYLMVKNDSVSTNRNAIYVPFDDNQVSSQSGSSYDSNFMELKSNTQYIINTSVVITKNADETNSSISFYFTSSSPGIFQESSYTEKYGIKILELQADTSSSIVDFSNTYTFYTPKSDLYGTLVIVPKLCSAYIKNISVKVYGDDGFSPDTYTTRIPWPVNVANESFQIKAELFDINNNLIYSDLKTLKNFDPSGSTIVYSTSSLLPYSSSTHYLSPDIDTGSIYFQHNTSTNYLYVYTGTSWVKTALT